MNKLFEEFKKRNWTLGSVESMTGGLFASYLTSIPGASKVFKGSLITYQVEEKYLLLGMKPEFVEKHGVVSKEVAEFMAKEGLRVLDVDVCISITGNAGPTVEPGGQEVGCAFVGIATKNNVFVEKLSLNGERNEIRNEAVLAMQDLLIKKVL